MCSCVKLKGVIVGCTMLSSLAPSANLAVSRLPEPEAGACTAAWLQVRSQAFSEPLWRHAAQAFIAIVPAGLPAVAATWVAEGAAAYGAGGATSGGAASGQPGELPAEDPTAAWAALATAFEGFLLGVHTSLGEPGDPGSGPVSPRGAAEGQQPFGGGGGGEGGEAAEGAAEGPHVEDPGMIVPGSRSHSSEGAEALAQAAATMDAGLDPAQVRKAARAGGARSAGPHGCACRRLPHSLLCP